VFQGANFFFLFIPFSPAGERHCGIPPFSPVKYMRAFPPRISAQRPSGGLRPRSSTSNDSPPLARGNRPPLAGHSPRDRLTRCPRVFLPHARGLDVLGIFFLPVEVSGFTDSTVAVSPFPPLSRYEKNVCRESFPIFLTCRFIYGAWARQFRFPKAIPRSSTRFFLSFCVLCRLASGLASSGCF